MARRVPSRQGLVNGSAGDARWVGRGVRFTLGAAIVVGLVGLGLAAAKVLLLVFIAVTFAAGLEPAIAWLRGRLGLGRGATILLVYGVFLVVVVGFAFVVLPAAAAQLVAATDALPAFFDQVRDWAAGLRPEAVGASIGRLADAAERLVAPGVAKPPTTGEAVEVGLTVVEALVTVATLLTVV